jgi:hypothetical protein
MATRAAAGSAGSKRLLNRVLQAAAGKADRTAVIRDGANACAAESAEHDVDLKGLGSQSNGVVNLTFRFRCGAAIKGS